MCIFFSFFFSLLRVHFEKQNVFYVHKFLKVFGECSSPATATAAATAYFARVKENRISTYKNLNRSQLLLLLLLLFVLLFFILLFLVFFYVFGVMKKAAKSNNRPKNNNMNCCRIPIDDEIYFYNFLKVEVNQLDQISVGFRLLYQPNKAKKKKKHTHTHTCTSLCEVKKRWTYACIFIHTM